MTSEAIPAATILLLRDKPDLQALMIERHADMKFAGGALVFPGGRIELTDQDPAWVDYVCGDYPVDQAAPRVGAIREAFEETGILLARRKGERDFIGDNDVLKLSKHRKAVEDDDQLFLELIRQEGLVLACDALVLYARWLPPEDVTHRRYFTWFFAALAPGNQTAREDGNEATDVVWVSPRSVVKEAQPTKKRMIFPTMRNVELLSVSQTAQEVLDFAQERKIETVQPKLIERGNVKYISIPDGLGYPIIEERLDKAIRK
ncbi:MAG: NUDIX hydrolase [Hyphococcus sp.]|nr:MAG: NUDIX hydrolase [Marinicaulis sp.]